MNSYFRRRSHRTRALNETSQPKECVRRPRNENRNESIREESYSRRGPPPRRSGFVTSRSEDYYEERYDRDRREAPALETVLGTTQLWQYSPTIINEMQKALSKNGLPDREDNETPEPNTNVEIARTQTPTPTPTPTPDEKTQEED